MGILFLVLTPALYCDVTDSWLLPNKWKRIWISAAGIYVECFLASIATFVWWYSTPGLMNSLAMATMFICSVNTIMFNANPLLRYDGYYVMADWLEIPNLRIKSTQFFALPVPGEGAGAGNPGPELHAAFAALPVRDLRGRQLRVSLVRHVRDPLVLVAGLEAVQARVGQLPAGRSVSLVPVGGNAGLSDLQVCSHAWEVAQSEKGTCSRFRRGGDRAGQRDPADPDAAADSGVDGAQAGQARRGLRRGRRAARRAQRQERRLGHERHGPGQAVQPREAKRAVADAAGPRRQLLQGAVVSARAPSRKIEPRPSNTKSSPRTSSR